MAKVVLTLYDPEKWDIVTGEGIVYLELDENPCTMIKGDFDTMTPEEVVAKSVSAKPAPPANMKWAVDNDCLFSIPMWVFGVNADKTYSFYAKGVKSKPLTVTIERTNVIPAVQPITKDLEFKAVGWEREGLNPNALPEYAGLFSGQVPGTYNFTLKEKLTGLVLDNKLQVTSEYGPSLVQYLAPNNTLEAPKVTNPVQDYTVTVNRPMAINLPSNLFTDSDGTISTISASGLPSGVSYDAVNAIIGGTPTVIGTYVIDIKATDNSGLSATDTFVLSVVADKGFQQGQTESYQGIFVSEPGMATRPEFLLLRLVSYDPVTQKAIVENGTNYIVQAGKSLLYNINGGKWLEVSEWNNSRFKAGSYYNVNFIEVDQNDRNPFELEKRSPFFAEHSFQIY